MTDHRMRVHSGGFAIGAPALPLNRLVEFVLDPTHDEGACRAALALQNPHARTHPKVCAAMVARGFEPESAA